MSEKKQTQPKKTKTNRKKTTAKPVDNTLQNLTENNWLNETRTRAAFAVAEDLLTDEEIADELEITRATLWNWKKNPVFILQVNLFKQKIINSIAAEGLRSKIGRVAALENLIARMNLIMSERGKEFKDMVGGASGLIVRDYKGTGENLREVFKFDSAFSREFRETLQQTARELGQWQDNVKFEDGSAGEAGEDLTLEQLHDLIAKGKEKAAELQSGLDETERAIRSAQ